uniref:Myb-like DNA-binding protein n=1 Tax=Phytophthora ramorum TaxID=164328 RepID=H3HDD6_PHYRM
KRERDASDDALRSFHEVPSDAQKPRAEEEKGKRWTPGQDDALRRAVDEFGQRNWKAIASRVDGRNHAQCLQRWNKVLKPGLVKGHWSFEEDSTLEQMVLQGCHSWGEVAAHIPGRTAKQCRERWRNHLDPSINKSPFTPEEDNIIQEGFEKMGNRWTQIAELLPGRTEDAVKLRWKALNPNQKVKAKPGRPKLMPGMTVNKQRSAAPPTPDDVAATLMNVPITMPEMPTYGNGYPIPMPYPDNSVPITPMPMPPLHPPQLTMPHPDEHILTTPVPMPSQYPEPSVEPLSDEVKAEDEMNDAAMLKELLRSHSNSLLSFGSTRGLSSFTDMSPEDLLASGELDEMFRATVNMMDSLTSSFKNPESLQKAVQNLDHDDKHLFQGLIDSWRAQKSTGGDTVIQEDDRIANLPVEPNAYSQHNFETSSGRNLTHSLDFEEARSLPRRNSNGISYELGNISNDIDDLLDSDLMRPIRKGKMY